VVNRQAKIFVAGHGGLVGSSIVRRLRILGYGDIVTRSRAELDLLSQADVFAFFRNESFDHVYLAAGKVGGIHANNSFPAEFIYENMMIEANLIHASHLANVPKLMYFGSSCSYPKVVAQPIKEESLLCGKVEPTNEPYAIAKIAGIKLCESYNRQYGRDYRSVIPANLYGPGDNFHPEHCHVIPAFIRRFHDAKQKDLKEVDVWGSGRPTRDFLHVDDMAAASVFVMELESSQWAEYVSPMLSHINIGSGVECSIRQLAETVAEVIGFEGRIAFDLSKPDGAPRRLLSNHQIATLGWRPEISLKQGIEGLYEWYLKNDIQK